MNGELGPLGFLAVYSCDTYGADVYNTDNCEAGVGVPNTGYAPAPQTIVPEGLLVPAVFVSAVLLALLSAWVGRRRRARR